MNSRRRRIPVNAAALFRHVSEYGFHFHLTSRPLRWVLVAGDEGYGPCKQGACLKTEPAKEAQGD